MFFYKKYFYKQHQVKIYSKSSIKYMKELLSKEHYCYKIQCLWFLKSPKSPINKGEGFTLCKHSNSLPIHTTPITPTTIQFLLIAILAIIWSIWFMCTVWRGLIKNVFAKRLALYVSKHIFFQKIYYPVSQTHHSFSFLKKFLGWYILVNSILVSYINWVTYHQH